MFNIEKVVDLMGAEQVEEITKDLIRQDIFPESSSGDQICHISTHTN